MCTLNWEHRHFLSAQEMEPVHHLFQLFLLYPGVNSLDYSVCGGYFFGE